MAKNIEFMGAVFPDVPSVQLPQYGGGLVGFDDTTDADATAEDIAQGKTAYVNGAKITGTGSGGGGGISIDDIAMRSISGVISGSAGYIGANAFVNCFNITAASFPQCSIISASAFSNCTNLKTADFPNASSIASNAFYGCYSLATVSFPKVSTIGNYAFYSCSSLTTADFPKASMVYATAFAYCVNLTNINLPIVISIGSNAFSRCSALASVSFPVLSSIQSYTFANCYSLSTVNFQSCSMIGSSAFVSCSALTTAIFNHHKVANGIVYTYAFRNCFNLLSLYLLASVVYSLSVSSTTFVSTPIAGYTTSTGGVYGSIFVPASLYDSYRSLANWSFFSSRFASLTSTEVQNVLTYGTHNP